MKKTDVESVNILDRITDGLMAVNQQWRITYLNSKAAELLSPLKNGTDELLGKNLWDEFPDLIDTPAHDEYRRAVDEQVSVSFELFYPPLGRWFDVRAYPSPDGLSIFFHDVSERKQAEAASRQREQELADFFENAAVGLHLVGPDGIILRANQAELDLTGYAPEEYIGRHIAEFHADPDAIQDILQRLMKNETLHNYEARLRRKDGSIRHVLISSNVRREDGKFIHTRCFTRDITERRLAEKELEERVRIALMSADIGVALTRSDTLREMLQSCVEALVKYLNAAFARIWTLNEKENVLELQVSAGMYTHTDGAHGRVPVGKFKIGLIAAERQPHLTNSVIGDERVGDQEWARRERMVGFAGYPLIVNERLVGVMAMFAREPLTEATLQGMESVANGIALGIERRRAEEDKSRLRDEIIQMQAARLEELSTPLIPLSDRIVVMPLIGTVDSERAVRALDTLANGVIERGARIAIIDITGVSTVDTNVASTLMRAAQVLRLLGAEAVLTGVRPRVAQTLVGLGVDLSSIVTRSNLQSGIDYAQKRLLMRVAPAASFQR
ncbi:MAG TPA: PAS domain-containing protein [Pyrinomonadaceae bacterium]|jgi:PAS domain S-box-containing protein